MDSVVEPMRLFSLKRKMKKINIPARPAPDYNEESFKLLSAFIRSVSPLIILITGMRVRYKFDMMFQQAVWTPDFFSKFGKNEEEDE